MAGSGWYWGDGVEPETEMVVGEIRLEGNSKWRLPPSLFRVGVAPAGTRATDGSS